MKDSKRLPDIQGLRGIAVLLVLFYHVWPEMLPGGFVGVDVFFVLSGYLITGILLREAKGRRIDLLAFYARRIRRLLPAATAVLLVSLILTVYTLPETKRIEYSADIVWAALYVVNWRFAVSSVDYGHRSADPSPVQHYWSLSIEEQFYIVWPVVAFLIARMVAAERQRRVFGLVSFAFFFVSFLHSVDFARTGSPAGYFLTSTRIWELASGAMLASFKRNIHSTVLADSLSWIGLFLIISSAFFLNVSMAFPGWVALLPVLGTLCLLASSAASDRSPSYLLRWKLLQGIGDISYSIYLWHWPIVRVLPELAGKETFLTDGRAIVVLSLLAGLAGKYIIEDPFRDGVFSAYLKRWQAVTAAAASVAVTATVSIGFINYQEEKERHAFTEERRRVVTKMDYPGASALDPESLIISDPSLPVLPDPLLAKKDAPVLYSDGCDARTTAEPCIYGNPSGSRIIVLLGDSHASQYLPALQVSAERHDWRIVVYQKSACMVSDSPVRIRSTGLIRQDCESWKKEAMAGILDVKPDMVVTSAALPVIYNEYYLLEPTAELISGYRSFWSRLTEAGIPVLVVRDNPRPGVDVPSCMVMNRESPGRCSWMREQVLDRHEDPLVEASQMTDVHLLDLSHFFCNGQECPAVIGNVLVYRDGDHLTASFAKSLAPYIEARMLEILKDDRK
jgi:peptidoglycan/LPS O-acetylase OafA/YrhL